MLCDTVFLQFCDSHRLGFGNLLDTDLWRSFSLSALIDAREFLAATTQKLNFWRAGKTNIRTERKMDFPGIVTGGILTARLTARLLRVLSVLCTISCRLGKFSLKLRMIPEP